MFLNEISIWICGLNRWCSPRMVDIIQLTEVQNEIKDRERNSSPLFLFPGFRARTLVLSCFWNINCTNGSLGSQAFGLYYYSRGTEPLTCGFRCYFHIESVSIELTCRIPSWSPENYLLEWGEPPKHIEIGSRNLIGNKSCQFTQRFNLFQLYMQSLYL